ncbi:MAG: RNA methyltransferase [Rhodospirillaceae bacterium]|nr:RNA methyltransferase [Rhodospirillaceae bacterium]
MAKSKHPPKHKSHGQKTRPQHGVAAKLGPARHGPASAPAKAPRQPLMLWGTHAVRAALANPQRRVAAGWATPSAQGELEDSRSRRRDFAWSTVTAAQLAARLPDGAVHQGVAVAVEPLRRVPLDAILAPEATARPLVVLDRVTDPHNVGAILRSCAVFGAAALITADRHAPPESGALAKAAAGALDLVPWVRVANLARALGAIRDAGWWVAGLDGSAEATVAGTGLADGKSRTALVLGAEGQGLRRLTKENCNILVRIPMQYANNAKCVNLIDSLNVSNAAAVALYELCRN